MDPGALYDLLYSNAPEIFFQIQVPESSLYFGPCAVRPRAAIYSDMEELLSVHFNYYLNRKFDIMADFVH